jgi:hypothetical protein
MAYSEDIDALNPDHRWEFNGNEAVDQVGLVNGTPTGMVSATAISEDVANSIQSNAIAGDRIALVTTTDINNSVQSRKAVGGWFNVSKINPHPVSIYNEGVNSLTYHLVMALGNAIMFEVVESAVSLQAFGIALVPNRNYHLYTEYQGTAFDDRIRLYIDGVLTEEVVVGVADLAARGIPEFADPSITVGVGGDVILLQAPVNGSYNQWATWSNKTLPTALEIREELFEKGALPEVTITNQAGLDVLAGTLRGNFPLCIRVNVAGSISLTADNITFDPLASIHIQYNGSGTLTWTNTNGSKASIGSVIGGGAINFVNPATLTILGVINGAEVRIYDDEIPNNNNYDAELDGIESNIGTSFSFAHGGSANTIIIQMLATGFVEEIVSFLLDSTNQTITLFPELEVNQ